jgi:ribosomal biogenesis protein LAS1
LQLPLTLLETRHRIVHRHLPSLAELKRAATEALQWLWDWYWAQLDHAFGQYPAEAEEGEDADAIREKIQGILKTYVKERKSEIKTRKKASKAAETALSTYTLRFSPNNTTTQKALLNSLETMILPADTKLGTTMSGAFLIWSPFLVAFSPILPTRILLNHLIRAMNAPTSSSRAMVNPEMDPVREGLCDWVVHILSSKEWPCATSPSFHEDILAQLFSEPTFWNLTVAERVVQDDRVVDRGMWKAVLDAARADGNGKGDEMDVEVEDMEKGMPVSGVMGEKEKSSGPRKVLGMWKARPIGWLPEGWEDDE